MRRKVSFHQLAEFELNDAAVFFEIERYGLGLRFLSALEAAVAHIHEYPEASPISFKTSDARCYGDFPTASCIRSNPIEFESLLSQITNVDLSIGMAAHNTESITAGRNYAARYPRTQN